MGIRVGFRVYLVYARFMKSGPQTRQRRILRHPYGYLNVAMDGMGCLDNIQHPSPTDFSTYKYQNFCSACPTAPAPAGPSKATIDRRARSVVHGDRGARCAARHHAHVRVPDQNAPRGLGVRRRHHAHRPGNGRHTAVACVQSRAQAPLSSARAAATAAHSTATGRPGRPAASSSRPSTLVGSGERKESSLRPLEKA